MKKGKLNRGQISQSLKSHELPDLGLELWETRVSSMCLCEWRANSLNRGKTMKSQGLRNSMMYLLMNMMMLELIRERRKGVMLSLKKLVWGSMQLNRTRALQSKEECLNRESQLSEGRQSQGIERTRISRISLWCLWLGINQNLKPVSYTHLTLPTIYSV